MINLRDVSKFDQIELEDVADLYLGIRNVNTRYRRVIEEIRPGTSRYLSSYFARKFVMAEISESEIDTEIERQKGLFHRSSYLLPQIFRFLSFEKERSMSGALSIIDDCHNDLPYVLTSNRRDKQKRDKINNLTSFLSSLEIFLEVAEGCDDGIKHQFERNSRLLNEINQMGFGSNAYFDSIVSQLKILSGTVDVYRLQIYNEDDPRSISNNQIRTHVVECAYTLSLWYKGPQLKTTPGSNFSSFCSSLFELVSGIADEGLAGAINRFSRSQQRKQIDEEELEAQGESELGDDVDNFYLIQRNMVAAEKSKSQYAKLLQSGKLSNEGVALLEKLSTAQDRLIKNEMKRHGPHIVWAHHMPYAANFDHSQYEMAMSKLIEAEVAIGQIRRQAALCD